MGFLLFFTILIIIIFSISRIVPLILSWFFERKYNIPMTIGRISLPYLKLCDITISKNEYTIQIEEVGIKSSFLNSELTKLITLVVRGVRINKSLSPNKSNGSYMKNKEHILDFRGKKIPHFINSFAQFMAVHVYNISAMLIQLETECLLQVLTKELHIDGSILKNAKSLLVTLNITDAYISVLKRADNLRNQSRTKLAEFSFGITMEASLVAQGPLSVEKLDLKMSHSRASIRSGFYSLLHRSKPANAEIKKDKPVDIPNPKAPVSKSKTYKKGETMIFESKSFSELHKDTIFDSKSISELHKEIEGQEKKTENVLERILPIKLDLKMSHSRASIRSGFYSLLHRSKPASAEIKKVKPVDIPSPKAPVSKSKTYRKGDTMIFESKSFSELHKDPIFDSKSISELHKEIESQEKKTEDVLERILPIVPKNCSLLIDDTSFKGYSHKGDIEYICSLKTLAVNYRSVSQTERNGVLFNFYLNNLTLDNDSDKTLDLKSCNINAKLKNNIVNIYLQQNNLLITYNHLFIHKWVRSNLFYKPWTPKAKKPESKPTDSQKKYSMLEEIIKNISVNFCAEISNVVAIIKLKSDSSSSIGVNKVRLMLDQVQESRGTKYESYLANLFLSDRHWQTELLIESLWWSFKEWNHGASVSKVLHVWGTPLYLGMGLIKFCTSEDEGLKIYSLLDTLQLEWSLKLADYAILALRSFLSYQFKIKALFKQKQDNTNSVSKVTTSIVISHFNCFLQSQNDEYFVSRLDTISIDSHKGILSFKFEEFKVFTLNNSGDYYTCIRTEDILNYKIFIKIAHLDYVKKENAYEYNISLLESSVAFWSTNFHSKALLLHRDISEFCSNFMKPLPKIKRKEVNMHPVYLPVKIINCNVFGRVEFHIDISKDHSAKIVLDELILSKHFHFHPDKQNFNYSINTVTVAIDGADTFELKGVFLKKICREDPLAKRFELERTEAEYHSNLNAKTWLVQFDLFKVVFPHEHNYAEAIQNQLLSVIKWLKIIHTKKEEEDTLQSMLKISAPDLLINVKEFLFEMSDDPFEVKLRDNFELLEDEYSESLKRQKMLKEKIGELIKTHLHMPAGKVEELYATLKKKNADIYIQRHKLMYQAAPQRTRLFAWSMTNVDLMVMTDIVQYNIIENIRKMDKDSPWPEENMEFSTLWYKNINLRCAEWKFLLRDFPQPLLEIKKLFLCGVLAGAEQVAPKRATRTVMVDLGEPFEPFEVERGMQPLKFYYDLNCEIESYSYAFGPCWEPVIAQCNLSFNKIFAPSRDPSPPLTFWDKMRLLMHGRLTMVVQQLQVLLHASLDPYNTTEEMALTWEKVIMDWTNAKLVFKGDLNIFVRTASKYDDVQLLKLPNLKLILGFHWVCLGDPNDHHSVIYCAPDKIPEYSSNQVHDSFRAFRSQNLNLSIVLETKPSSDQTPNSCPILLLYGSTLRWIENLKLILSGVTRPTKRGQIFNNLRPRKPQLSRHYKKINLLVGLHKFQVCYWMSFAMHRGCELFGGRLSSSSEHSLSLVAVDDGLKHRPKAEWSIVYMNSELSDSEIWLKSALQDDSEIESSRIQPVEKTYCLSVAKVSYGREAVFPNQTTERNKDTPTHRLVVYDLRGAWTKSNRNVAFALFDTFMKTTRTKKNLSTEALKGFRKDTNTTPMKRRSTDPTNTPPNTSIQAIQSASTVQDTPSPISKLQSGHAANMLQQLIAEADNNSIVYSDDLSAVSRQQHLQGVQACQEDDVVYKNWQISLVNAQVLLKGCETNGYVILSAAKAEIVQRVHRPAWKERTLVSKTTWTGLLECMQYYATVNAGENDANENIMWLTVDNIQEKESAEISEPSEVPNMVGSGVSVGAVVSDTVGPSTSAQLQRIVSRCKCEFYYAGYGDISINPEGIGEIPPPPPEDVSPWDSRQSGVDAFTLMHYDLDVCTNSLQYAMLLDIINNLLLYVEPHRKEALEKLARMRFQLQLYSVEDQRRPIQEKQTIVRTTMNKLRRLEKDTYMVNKTLEENPDDIELRQELDRLERLMHDCKMNLNAQSEELDMMLSCYKETQLLANARIASTRSDKPLTIVRANEICFKHAQWRLTEADGQIGIADLVLSNFLYTKNSKSDDSVEHLLELGYLRMTNLIPNEIYKDILCPTEIQYDMPIEHKKVLRIFCREKPPVGGISVKEHFEINLVPLTIGLTKKFFLTMMKFSFPERDTESSEYNDRASEDGDAEPTKSKKGKGKKNRDSNFYVHIDEVEKMKERAEKNKLFVYIKIPEVPVKASYKGTKEKNLEDLRDVSILIPTLEYHNMTWTWLDLLMAIINDTKKVILSQAIKQKLQIKRSTGTGEDSSAPQEEDKAKMLLGNRHHKMKNVGEKAPENKSIRKGVSEVFKLGK